MKILRPNKIQRLRVARGWTLDKLAKEVDPRYERRHADYWEKHGANLTGKLSARLAEILGVSIDELLQPDWYSQSNNKGRRC